MKNRIKIVTLLAVSSVAFGHDGVEPSAGTWKTWVLPSPREFSVPEPPDAQDTRAERARIKELMDQATKDPAMMAKIKYWDAGSPGYRWMEALINRLTPTTPGTTMARAYAYLSIAIYDSTIATWNYKYQYNRARPSHAEGAAQANIRLDALLDVPGSPSYPSAHSAVAFAAAEVLAAMFPADAAMYRAMAEEAGQSRVNAGVNHPSDHTAGAELGKKIGLAVMAKAAADGSTTPFTGTMPTGKCFWTGTNPGNAGAVNWRPFLLLSASEFRPAPPPACDSPQMVKEVADVKNFPRAVSNFVTNERVFYWQGVDGREIWPYRLANQWMAEDRLDKNPPRAARAYALLAVSYFDVFIASQDGKFTYWYLRPHQLDTTITPLIPVPNFPAYPSNHSSFSATRGEILAYLFPTRAAQARAMAKEAGDSRIWGGIHYEIDNAAGVELGKKVAGKFIDWANKDGSQ